MRRPRFWKRFAFWVGLTMSLALLALSWQGRLRIGSDEPVSLTETLGFVTGAACVYLTVVENVWNFPVGIANNVFFLALFAGARLYGDAGLQVLYIALGIQGWYLWLRGGEGHTPLRVSRAGARLLLAVGACVVLCTALLTFVFVRAHDSAPFLDALTTVLSLAAQYLLNRKAIENWFFWMAADVVCVYLYFVKDLRLTGVLFFVFLCMCVAGLKVWLRALREGGGEAGVG
jgi:nicotinamide mononucleotide transporter